MHYQEVRTHDSVDVFSTKVDEKRASRSTSRDKRSNAEKRSLSTGYNPLTEEANLTEDKVAIEEATAKVSTAEERNRKNIGQMKAIQSGVS